MAFLYCKIQLLGELIPPLPYPRLLTNGSNNSKVITNTQKPQISLAQEMTLVYMFDRIPASMSVSAIDFCTTWINYTFSPPVSGPTIL